MACLCYRNYYRRFVQPNEHKNSLIVEQWLASVVDGGPTLTQHWVNGVSAVYVDGHINIQIYCVDVLYIDHMN